MKPRTSLLLHAERPTPRPEAGFPISAACGEPICTPARGNPLLDWSKSPPAQHGVSPARRLPPNSTVGWTSIDLTMQVTLR